MAFWSKQEQEMLLGIRADEPHRVLATSTWPYYVTRLGRCEGFTATGRHKPAEGGEELVGELDLSQFRYLFLRNGFGSDRAEREHWNRLTADRDSGLIPEEAEQVSSDYRMGAHERETTFLARAAEPYWLTIETDAAIWLRRLDEHPYAVKVRVTTYGGEDADSDEGQVCCRYLFPRKLLTIRRNKPQYSEAYKQQLRDRLAAVRPD